MRQIILEKIREIEQVENVNILFAIESGSRAWGFASPDSDYDVRFVYVRPANEYLRLEKRRDVIEFMLDETLDINGWDLDKTLRLLYSSNPTLFEWCNSPIIYKTTEFHQQLKDLLPKYFMYQPGLYHYLSMAKRNFGEYLKVDKVKLKKYLYVIRPILACRWILERGTPPPMLFSELVESQLEEEVKPIVHNLLQAKMSTPEVAQSPRIDALNEWIEKSLTQVEKAISVLPKSNKTGWSELNTLFCNILNINK